MLTAVISSVNSFLYDTEQEKEEEEKKRMWGGAGGGGVEVGREGGGKGAENRPKFQPNK